MGGLRSRGLGSLAWLGTPLLTAVYALGVTQSAAQWSLEWASALEVVSSSVILGAPLTAGFACFDSYERARSGMTEIGVCSPRARAQVLRSILGAWIPSVLAFTTVTVYAYIRTAAADTAGWPSAWPAVAPLVLLLGAASVGALLGRWIPRLWFAPIVTVGFFMALIICYNAGLKNLVEVGSRGYDTTSAQVRWQAILMLCVFWLMIALLCSCLALTPEHGWRVEPRTKVTVVAGITLIAGAALLFGRGERLATVQKELVCVGEAPAVCGPTDYANRLEQYRATLVETAAPLRERGVDIPTRYVVGQGAPSLSNDGTVGNISPGQRTMSAEAAEADLVYSLTGCTNLSEYRGDERTLFVLALVLSAINGTQPIGSLDGVVSPSFLDEDRETQLTWLIDGIEAWSECRSVDIP